MKINKKLYIQLLEEELAYERSEHGIALADLKREQRIGEEYEKENAQLLFKNNDINDDFFRLGDMFMAATGKEHPERKMDVVIIGSLAFMEKNYQSRIEYLEDLIFELGDEIQGKGKEDDVVELHEALSQWEDYFFILGDQCIYDSRTMVGKLSDASKDLEDMKADMAIDYAELKEEYRQILEDFKAKNVKLGNDLFRSEGKIKTLEESTVDPKAQLLLGAEVTGLKAKVVQLQGEIEKHLKTIGELESKNEGLKKSKEEAFDEDRKQIAEEIEKAEQSAPKKKSSTTGENTPKTKAKSIGENTITILGIKNKLCNKGYDVQDTGKSLLAKKPGNRHIEVKHAELPGSFKYIICGQTCYEFDQALKASAYGAKAITPKLDSEAIS